MSLSLYRSAPETCRLTRLRVLQEQVLPRKWIARTVGEKKLETKEEIGGKTTYGLITTQKGQTENVVKKRFIRDELGTQAE